MTNETATHPALKFLPHEDADIWDKNVDTKYIPLSALNTLNYEAGLYYSEKLDWYDFEKGIEKVLKQRGLNVQYDFDEDRLDTDNIFVVLKRAGLTNNDKVTTVVVRLADFSNPLRMHHSPMLKENYQPQVLQLGTNKFHHFPTYQ